MAKPRVATAHLTGCFGCHMSLLDIDERILDAGRACRFRQVADRRHQELHGPVDVGLIEGGCSNDENVEVLRAFRKHCNVLSRSGECALTGGVPSMRNLVPLRECLEEAYLNGPTVVDRGDSRTIPRSRCCWIGFIPATRW